MKPTRSMIALSLIWTLPAAIAVCGTCGCQTATTAPQPAPLNQPPDGFTALFNGKDLTGWWGWSTKHYKHFRERHIGAEKAAQLRAESQADIHKHWRVENGILVNDGKGLNLTTNENHRDFELLVDCKMAPGADSGIYLRGIPQVQIWDHTDKPKWKHGADKGSGGLWNNPPGTPGKDPLVLADKPAGEWNHFRIKMIGSYVNVWLNGKRVVQDAPLHNFFEKKTGKPIPADGPIQLQTHGGKIEWRNLFIREIDADEAADYLRTLDGEGFQSIFNGRDFEGWVGPTDKNAVQDGTLLSKHGTIYTETQYEDFVVRFDFKLPPGGNNGLAIRYPGRGDTAYVGMCELQVLDNTAKRFANLRPQQYHGSVYGQVAAERGYLRPVGEWNHEKVTVKGHRITVELNGAVITDADLSQVKQADTMYDLAKFKGRMRTKGHFGFAGHGAPVVYRNIEIKELN